MGGFRDSIESALPGLSDAWNTFKEGLLNIWEMLKSAVSALKQAWDNDFAGIRTIVETVFGIIGNVIAGTIEVLSGLLEFIGSVFKGDWEGAWNAIVGVFGNVWNRIVEIFTTVSDMWKTLFNALKDWLVGKWEDIKTTFSEAIQAIMKFFIDLPGNIWNAIVSAIDRVIEWGNRLINEARIRISEMVDTIFNYASQVPGKVWSAIVGAVQKVIDWGSNLFEAAKTAIGKMIDGIVEKASSIWGTMTSIGKNVIEGFWNGINNAWDWLVGKISGFFGGVEQAIKDFFGIKSPSKKAMTWGKFLVEGFLIGMESMSAAVENTIQDVFSGMPDSFDYSLNGTRNLTPATAPSGGFTGNAPIINQNFYQPYQSPYELQMAARAEAEKMFW